jgi:ketosteroid isomerase-like protein
MIYREPADANERTLLRVAQLWEQYYNDDVSRMVSDCYAPDADIFVTGASVHGRATLDQVEKEIENAVPGRRMRVDRAHFAGTETIVLEAVILDDADADYFSPFCTVLTIRDGLIVNDHTYLDPGRWPGLAAAAPLVTPGGLGTPESWSGI